MVHQVEFSLPPYPYGIHLVTNKIVDNLPALPDIGLLNIFIRHTSAAITINENADPSVRNDFDSFFNRLVPEGQNWFTHSDEGPDDMPAHLKASLIGFSVSIPILNGKLSMGIWQGIYLCEFRRSGGSRRFTATIIE
jgi:secondary thiamine-phosphate synthase enzyme